MGYGVILYYKYVPVPDPAAELAWQRALCERLGLKGRVILATEGVNGTLAGPIAAIDAYITAMSSHPQFSGISYKRDVVDTVPFPRLRIKVRPEIVTLGAEADVTHTAPKLTPAQFHTLAARPDVVLFDARNDYESAIGAFEGAITPGIRHFKDLPAALVDYAGLKDKTIVTYCTGGIRCEKASALMRARGFRDVYQLEGGIIEYAKAYPDGAFKGRCFVFDERMSVGFRDDAETLGHCHFCAGSTTDYHNCVNLSCHELMLICPNCVAEGRVQCGACEPVAPAHVKD
jgi:UPF0176 protein